MSTETKKYQKEINIKRKGNKVRSKARSTTLYLFHCQKYFFFLPPYFFEMTRLCFPFLSVAYQKFFSQKNNQDLR